MVSLNIKIITELKTIDKVKIRPSFLLVFFKSPPCYLYTLLKEILGIESPTHVPLTVVILIL